MLRRTAPRAAPLTAARRPSTRLLLAVLAALLAIITGLAGGVPALAVPPPPSNPSDEEIEQSHVDAEVSAAEVGRLAGLVARTEGDIQRLQADMQLRGEIANRAAVDLQVADSDARAAEDAAELAQGAAVDAVEEIDEARAKAAAFAAASFRQGSVLGSMTALLDSGSPTELLQRRELLDQISASQLNAIGNLRVTQTQKANLDSAARAALGAATAAEQRADEAKEAAEAAREEAAAALRQGEDQLVALGGQLAGQRADYESALANVAGLQEQREAYNEWLAQKLAEEEAARQAAEEAARLAAEEAARQAAEEAARLAAEEAARQAAAQAAAEQAAAQAAAEAEAAQAAEQAAAAQAAAEAAAAAVRAAAEQAAAEAASERAAAEQEAQNQAARAAQEALAAQANESFYPNCDAARAAGRGPIPRGADGYRSALDPNNNGIACEGTAQAAAAAAAAAAPAAAPAPIAPVAATETYYATCDAARAAGRGPIKRGEDGYRSALDPNNNGIACEGTAQAAASSGSAQAAASSGSTLTAVIASADSSSRGQTVVNAALRWLGTPYAWGGGNSKGPTLGIRDGGVADRNGDYKKVGFDCSGLALYAYAQVGVSLPHYSGYQYSGQPKVSRSQLQVGDLVFWARNTSDPSTVHHVAIWMGNDQIVEAPNSGSFVKISAMRWNNFIGATRPR